MLEVRWEKRMSWTQAPDEPCPEMVWGAGVESTALSSLPFLLPNGEVKQTWTHEATELTSTVFCCCS